MEGFFETITRGNVTEVKVVLASVVMALAGYQVFLIAIGYGKLRLRFLEPAPATRAHRAIGGTIVVVSLLVAAMCLAYFELDEAAVHAVVASALLAVLACPGGGARAAPGGAGGAARGAPGAPRGAPR
ncbi:MAG: DUF6529 family protein, partial [Solirubrobacterales bacterium]